MAQPESRQRNAVEPISFDKRSNPVERAQQLQAFYDGLPEPKERNGGKLDVGALAQVQFEAKATAHTNAPYLTVRTTDVVLKRGDAFNPTYDFGQKLEAAAPFTEGAAIEQRDDGSTMVYIPNTAAGGALVGQAAAQAKLEIGTPEGASAAFVKGMRDAEKLEAIGSGVVLFQGALDVFDAANSLRAARDIGRQSRTADVGIVDRVGGARIDATGNNVRSAANGRAPTNGGIDGLNSPRQYVGKPVPGVKDATFVFDETQGRLGVQTQTGAKYWFQEVAGRTIIASRLSVEQRRALEASILAKPGASNAPVAIKTPEEARIAKREADTARANQQREAVLGVFKPKQSAALTLDQVALLDPGTTAKRQPSTAADNAQSIATRVSRTAVAAGQGTPQLDKIQNHNGASVAQGADNGFALMIPGRNATVVDTNAGKGLSPSQISDRLNKAREAGLIANDRKAVQTIVDQNRLQPVIGVDSQGRAFAKQKLVVAAPAISPSAIKVQSNVTTIPPADHLAATNRNNINQGGDVVSIRIPVRDGAIYDSGNGKGISIADAARGIEKVFDDKQAAPGQTRQSVIAANGLDSVLTVENGAVRQQNLNEVVKVPGQVGKRVYDNSVAMLASPGITVAPVAGKAERDRLIAESAASNTKTIDANQFDQLTLVGIGPRDRGFLVDNRTVTRQEAADLLNQGKRLGLVPDAQRVINDNGLSRVLISDKDGVRAKPQTGPTDGKVRNTVEPVAQSSQTPDGRPIVPSTPSGEPSAAPTVDGSGNGQPPNGPRRGVVSGAEPPDGTPPNRRGDGDGGFGQYGKAIDEAAIDFAKNNRTPGLMAGEMVFGVMQKEAQRNNEVGLLTFDLNDLGKSITTVGFTDAQRGIEDGAKLLATAAVRIKEQFPDIEVIPSRFLGDEFSLMLLSKKDRDGVVPAAAMKDTARIVNDVFAEYNYANARSDPANPGQGNPQPIVTGGGRIIKPAEVPDVQAARNVYDSVDAFGEATFKHGTNIPADQNAWYKGGVALQIDGQTTLVPAPTYPLRDDHDQARFRGMQGGIAPDQVGSQEPITNVRTADGFGRPSLIPTDTPVEFPPQELTLPRRILDDVIATYGGDATNPENVLDRLREQAPLLPSMRDLAQYQVKDMPVGLVQAQGMLDVARADKKRIDVEFVIPRGLKELNTYGVTVDPTTGQSTPTAHGASTSLLREMMASNDRALREVLGDRYHDKVIVMNEIGKEYVNVYRDVSEADLQRIMTRREELFRQVQIEAKTPSGQSGQVQLERDGRRTPFEPSLTAVQVGVEPGNTMSAKQLFEAIRVRPLDNGKALLDNAKDRLELGTQPIAAKWMYDNNLRANFGDGFSRVASDAVSAADGQDLSRPALPPGRAINPPQDTPFRATFDYELRTEFPGNAAHAPGTTRGETLHVMAGLLATQGRGYDGKIILTAQNEGGGTKKLLDYLTQVFPKAKISVAVPNPQLQRTMADNPNDAKRLYYSEHERRFRYAEGTQDMLDGTRAYAQSIADDVTAGRPGATRARVAEGLTVGVTQEGRALVENYMRTVPNSQLLLDPKIPKVAIVIRYDDKNTYGIERNMTPELVDQMVAALPKGVVPVFMGSKLPGYDMPANGVDMTEFFATVKKNEDQAYLFQKMAENKVYAGIGPMSSAIDNLVFTTTPENPIRSIQLGPVDRLDIIRQAMGAEKYVLVPLGPPEIDPRNWQNMYPTTWFDATDPNKKILAPQAMSKLQEYIDLQYMDFLRQEAEAGRAGR